MNLTQSYFELFNLPAGFDVDVAGLTPVYRELQRQYHPDRFADKAAEQQRLAVQYAALVNAAYDTLRDPLQRARYLLELAGHPVAIEKATVSDVDFLAAQMELREELEEAETLEQLDALREEVEEWQAGLIREFGIDYAAGDWSEAADTVRKLQFMARFLDEVRVAEERLEDAEFDE